MKKNLFVSLLFCGISAVSFSQIKISTDICKVKTPVESRAINFENPSGEPGQGGKTASNLGVGRKGSPAKIIQPHEEVTLCDINGSGTIRHIWFGGDGQLKNLSRHVVIRAYWDGQKYPSIECPLGDFMGYAHAKVTPYQSAVHTISEIGGLNIWLPMPFKRNAKIILTNESEKDFYLFFQIDYTIKDKELGQIKLYISGFIV
jgi:hypothetical protein